MPNQHLIGRETFELQLPGFQKAHAWQEQFSQFHWQLLVPAMEQLFDRLVGEDMLLRIEKLEINLGQIATQDLLSPKMMAVLMEQLEEAILAELQHPAPQNRLMRPQDSWFEKWLFFLEYGYLPMDAVWPESPSIWQMAIFETLALEERAVAGLRRLLLRQHVAFDRLLAQHDTLFLQKIVELLTAYPQAKLRQNIERMALMVGKGAAALKAYLQAQEQLNEGQNQSKTKDKSTTLRPTAQQKKAQELGAEQRKPDIEKKLDPSLVNLINDLLREQQGAGKSIVTRSDFLQRLLARLQSRWHPILAMPSRQIVDWVEEKSWRLVLAEVVQQGRKLGADQWLQLLLEKQELLATLPLVQALFVGAEQQQAWTAQLEGVALVPRFLLQELDEATNPEESPNSPNEIAASKATVKAAGFKPEGEDAFFVLNAGIILLHPFLAHLFKKLGWVEGQQFITEAHRQKALLLLHFLATGETQTPEFNLVLPKFICGLPLNVPVDHRVALSQDEQAEAEHMMEAAIEYWEAIGAVSVEGLREGFLQREGKLKQQPTGWTLQVERKTLDILIDRLPWNISLIKLPWMDEILRVEWTK